MGSGNSGCLSGQVDEFEELVKRYLAAIPPADTTCPAPKPPDKLNPLNFKFPDGVVQEDVR